MRRFVATILSWFALASTAPTLADEPQPNILWITSDDNGPHLGCYGDTFATTPNLDRLAARGMIYTKCWSNGPVCAPARTAIISGMYPTSTGSEHMRSTVRLPAGMKMYPQFLREAGYHIRYRPIASEQLGALSTHDQPTVVDSVDEQLRHEAEVETRNRKRMRPNNLATWELRVGDLRVFYEIEPTAPASEEPALTTVVVLAAGLKKGNRLWIGNEEVEL